MAKRESGYARKPRDAYMTPAWVTWAVIEELRLRGRGLLAPGSMIWEPACGTGQMSQVLAAAKLHVVESDIEPQTTGGRRFDFLATDTPDPFTTAKLDGIFTNPPYSHAEEFIERALALTEPRRGIVAMLLAVDFDSAKGRQRFFAEHPAFGLKLVLTDRITWFEPELPPPGVDDVSTPSDNHAWFIWDWSFRLGMSLAYSSAPEPVLRDLSAKRSEIRRKIRERNAAAAPTTVAAE